jgi:hypothetical protein
MTFSKRLIGFAAMFVVAEGAAAQHEWDNSVEKQKSITSI